MALFVVNYWLRKISFVFDHKTLCIPLLTTPTEAIVIQNLSMFSNRVPGEPEKSSHF